MSTNLVFPLKNSFLSALFFLIGKGLELEEERKRLLLIFIQLTGVPVLFIFAFLHISKGNYDKGTINVVLCLLLVASLFFLRFLKSAAIIYRINLALIGSVLLSYTVPGGIQGSTILWMYIFPMVSFFLLGKREGLLWSMMLSVTWLFFVIYPNSNFASYPDEPIFKLRFFATYGLVCAFVYIFESSREKSHKGMEQRQEMLEKEKGNLRRQMEELSFTQQLLKESEEKYRSILENMVEGYYEVDLDGNLTFFNDAFCIASGLSKEGLEGVSSFKFMDQETQKQVFEVFNEVFKTGESAKGFDYYFKMPDGTRIFVESSVSLIKDADGKAIGFRAIMRDVSERKRMEENYKKAKEAAEAANQAKSEFLANMSHEIRTPMNGIIGFTDMILDTPLNEHQMDHARTIKQSGEVLLSLINDILDFSKIEARALDLEEIDFDPELLAYDVCTLISPRLASTPVELLCQIGEKVPYMVRGDPGRFRQVITNLIGNATKFTKSGEIQLTVDVEKEKAERILLHTTVRDTGEGIPDEKLALIFEPFEQADGSTTRKFGGTGLGLAICRQISQLMEGDVWAETEEGKGSIFHFTAWVEKSEGRNTKRFPQFSLSGKKALVLDDNQRNLDLIKEMLDSAGVKSYLIKDGRDAIQALEEAFDENDPFDVFISDVQLPHMSGYDVAKSVLAYESKNSSLQSHVRGLPLIALSSFVEREASKCESVGFTGFLSKPIQRRRLYQILEKILGDAEFEKERDKTESRIVTQHSVREDRKGSIRILVAEDNPVNQKLAEMMLTKAGYQVEVANDGLEAVEIYCGRPDEFDLIFMDVQMPKMDGLEATKAIREKGFNELPIVAMTAHAMKGDREKCLEAGMNDYLPKPIKREGVFKLLEEWVFK